MMHERKRSSSIDLGLGQPTLLPDTAAFDAANEWVRVHGCPYAPNAGFPELRENIARIYGGRHGGSLENVCVTSGSQEAIYLAIKVLLEPGRDEVLITDPGYLSYQRCCDIEGVECHSVRLSPDDGFSVKADDLLAALTPATRMIMLGSPANPTGSIIAESDMRRLADALLERAGPPVFVAVDEVYRELSFEPGPYQSLLDIYPHTLAFESLSKSCALTGLRLGFLIAPSDAIAAVTRAHALLMLAVNTHAQQVALEITREPKRLRAHHDWYRQQRDLLRTLARDHRLQIVEPQGAFYCMLRLPDRFASSERAAEDLLERHDVVTVPGGVFGSGGEGFLRITWAAQAADLTEGLKRIAEFFASA